LWGREAGERGNGGVLAPLLNGEERSARIRGGKDQNLQEKKKEGRKEARDFVGEEKDGRRKRTR